MISVDAESNSAPNPSRKKINPNQKNEYGEEKLEYGANFTYVKHNIFQSILVWGPTSGEMTVFIALSLSLIHLSGKNRILNRTLVGAGKRKWNDCVRYFVDVSE